MKQKSKNRFPSLYHVTPKENLTSIRRQGLLPEASKGIYARIWLCEKEMIAWALNHVSQWQEVSQDALAVLHVVVERKVCLRARKGIYYTFDKISKDQVLCEINTRS